MQEKIRGRRKVIVGVVSSDKMNKTVVIEVGRHVKHPKYGKFVRKATVYKAHDEENKAKVGDKVEIVEVRPLSKTKRWRLVRVIE
ncbi:MAG: 30S ribosomal protein S17 [Candidatus Brocadiales bacterium]